MLILLKIKKYFRILFFFFAIFFIAEFLFNSVIANVANAAYDAPPSFTLDAQVFQAGTSNPLLDPNVKIKVQILNQNKDCVLYEEEQSADTTNSNGYFILHVGSGVGNGIRTVNDAGHTMIELFQNTSLITGKSLSDLTTVCNSATSLAALSKSVRFFRVTITASSNPEVPDVLTPDMQVESVPTALIAETLQGLNKNQFVQTNSGQGLTQANLESIFARFTNLDAILGSNTPGNISANVGGTASNVTGTVGVGNGGTGAATAAAARANLGLDNVLHTTGGTMTAQLRLSVGTTTAGAAPLKFVAGTNLTNPEPGAIEFDGTSLFYTTSASIRQTVGAVGAGLTALTGDVSATGAGSVAATVISVGSSSAANIHTAELEVNTNATSNSIASKLVRRDSSGAANFKNIKLDGATAGTLTLAVPSSLTNYSLTWPATVPSNSNSLLSSDTSGVLSWMSLNGLSVAIGTVSVTYGTAANTALQGNQSLAGDVTGLIGATSVSAIKGKTITAAPTLTGQVYRYDGTSLAPAFLSMFDLRSTVTGSVTFGSGSTGCTANQTLTWTSASDNLACTNIAITSAQVAGLVTSATVDTTNADNITSGTIAGARLPASATAWSAVTGGINYAGGNVGIGTTTPNGRLTLKVSSGDVIQTFEGAGGQTGRFDQRYKFESSQHKLGITDSAGSWIYNFVWGAGNTHSYNFFGTGNTTFSGNVGIGTTTPVTSLDVAKEIKVGATGGAGLACSMTTKGSIRYNDVSNVLEFCNGTGWNLIQAAACSDATPNVFSFIDEVNVTTASLITSNIVQITGINCAVPVTISGSGSPQYQICSDAACASPVQGWTSSPSSITVGQYVQTRLTSDSVGGSPFKATIIIGSGASVWTVTTAGDCSGSPQIGTVCTDGTVYAGLTPDGNVPMYTTRCDYGQTWNGTSCTGLRTALTWNNGSSNFTVTGLTSVTTGSLNTSTLYANVDAGSAYSAAASCYTLNANSHSTGWYLPAKAELNVLYGNNEVIKNFDVSGYYYWSSTENQSSNAWGQRFSDGGQSNGSKNFALWVRCVRK